MYVCLCALMCESIAHQSAIWSVFMLCVHSPCRMLSSMRARKHQQQQTGRTYQRLPPTSHWYSITSHTIYPVVKKWYRVILRSVRSAIQAERITSLIALRKRTFRCFRDGIESDFWKRVARWRRAGNCRSIDRRESEGWWGIVDRNESGGSAAGEFRRKIILKGWADGS